MNYAFVVQARLGSTRLPGKILKPFYGNQSILDLMVHKLSAISNIPVIIATTNSVINEPIEKKALALGVKCFRGEENDVLKRFIDVAEYFDIQGIFRICSDNPFLDVHAARQLVEIAMKSCNDYISFDIDGTPSIKTHFGFWGEFVTLDALKRVIGFTDDYCIVNMLLIIYIVILNFLIFNGFQDLQSCQNIIIFDSRLIR